MGITINECGISISISYTDERQPILVLQGEEYPIGYNLDPDTGELIRVCICAAGNKSKCMYGACEEVEETPDRIEILESLVRGQEAQMEQLKQRIEALDHENACLMTQLKTYGETK